MKNLVKTPTIDEIFSLIESGKFSMEDDEVVSFYKSENDKLQNEVSTASYSQIMSLYSENLA